MYLTLFVMYYPQFCSNACEINKRYPLHLQWNESTDKLNQYLKHWQFMAVSNTRKISFRMLFYISDFHVHYFEHYCQLHAIPVWQQTKNNEYGNMEISKELNLDKIIKTENVWKQASAVFESSIRLLRFCVKMVEIHSAARGSRSLQYFCWSRL